MTRPLRVAIIDHSAVMGGGEYALVRLLQCLDRTRVEPVVILPSIGSDVAVAVRSAGARVVESPMQVAPPGSAHRVGSALFRPRGAMAATSMIRNLSKLLRAERIDVVLTYSMRGHVLGSFAAWVARIPVCWYVHDVIDWPYYGRTGLRLVRAVSIFARRMLCNSASSAAALIRLGIPSQKVAVVGLPPIEDFVGAVDLRSELGLAVGTPLVGCVGRIVEPKGHLDFVRAAALVAERLPTVQFVIVGDSLHDPSGDMYRRRVAAEATLLDLNSRLHWLGQRPDVQGILADFDILVSVPRWPEGFGLVVAEAMLAGTTVVSTAVGGLAELAIDGKTAIVVPPANPEAIAAAVVLLLENHTWASEIAAVGRRHAASLLTLANVRTLEDELLRLGSVKTSAPMPAEADLGLRGDS